MKNITTLLLATLFVSLGVSAQSYGDPSYFSSCNSATNSITPVSNSLPGFYPADSLLPCIPQGQVVHDTIYFKNFTTASGITVQALKFDSIYLPAGLCWSTDKVNNTFATGEDGVIYISGTTTAAAGRYKLHIIIDLTISGPVTLHNQNAEALAGWRYYMRVACSGGGCTTLNRNDSVSIYLPDNSCGSSTINAYISANGATTFCPGGSVVLTASSGSGYSYHWSTGATTQSITVSTSGSYDVTVHHATDSAVAPAVGVTVLSHCSISATITPSGSTAICPGGSVTLTATSGSGYSYHWSTGATTQSIVVTSAGGYVVTISNGVDTGVSSLTTVTISSSCANNYNNTTYFSMCNSGTTSITPIIGTIPGLSPSDSALPCAVSGQVVHDTIYFKNFSTVSGFTVSALKFDSIYLPAGLCWQTNKVNNTFGTGEDGVIYISGTTTAPAGRYKLRIIVDVTLASLGPLTNQNAEVVGGLRYFMRVSCPSASCPGLNRADSVSIYIPDTACSGSTLAASITPNGPTTFCPGDSVRLTANSGSGYIYRWSTGATTSSITVHASGSYGLTVYSGSDSAIASPLNVTALSSCSLTATITASGPTTFCSGGSVSLTANSGSGYIYHWSTGSFSSTIVVTSSGSYTVTVVHGTDTAVSAPTVVTVSTGCSSNATYWNPAYFSVCNNGTNAITPGVGTTPGFYPVDSLQPVAPQGQVVHDTIYFTNYSTLSGISVQSLKFDSIYLPAGLCWSTNKVNNTYTGGENGVIYIGGTVTAPAGQYKLRIICDVTIAGGVTLTRVDLDAMAHLRYSLRVSCTGHPHPAFIQDTLSAFIADNACTSALAHITTNGGTSLCPGEGIVLSADSAFGNSYAWSNGATVREIYVTTGGTYTVTVTNGSATASDHITVTVHPGPYAHFQLFPDPNAAHVWVAVNQCTGTDIRYEWTWGDGTGITTGATPTHYFDSAGYYTVCVAVWDTFGCPASFCDSSTYFYKSDNQMIQMNVVQYVLGVNDIDQNTLNASYYNGAIHFSSAILLPSDIKLYDMSGRVIIKQNNWTGKELPLDGYIAGGVYVIAVQNNAMTLSRKLSITR